MSSLLSLYASSVAAAFKLFELMGAVMGVIGLASGCQDGKLTDLSCPYRFNVKDLSSKIYQISRRAFYMQMLVRTMVLDDCKEGATHWNPDPQPNYYYGFPFAQTCYAKDPDEPSTKGKYCNFGWGVVMQSRYFDNQLGRLPEIGAAVKLDNAYKESDIAERCDEDYHVWGYREHNGFMWQVCMYVSTFCVCPFPASRNHWTKGRWQYLAEAMLHKNICELPVVSFLTVFPQPLDFLIPFLPPLLASYLVRAVHKKMDRRSQ